MSPPWDASMNTLLVAMTFLIIEGAGTYFGLRKSPRYWRTSTTIVLFGFIGGLLCIVRVFWLWGEWFFSGR